jgi:type VI secretion system protein ImpK
MDNHQGTSQQGAGTFPQQEANAVPMLLELLEPGMTLASLVRAKVLPRDYAAFHGKVTEFLVRFERQASYYGKPPGAVAEAKYAFCALFDETVLSMGGDELAERWSGAPLQLQHFGEHLAGEGFFQHLDRLRTDPQQNIEILDVYYNCLLLGFKGRYLIEGTELLDLLATRLRQEILLVKGGDAPFAPHARPSKRANEFIRKSLPLWVYFSAFALLAALLWVTQKVWLIHHVGQARKIIG